MLKLFKYSLLNIAFRFFPKLSMFVSALPKSYSGKKQEDYKDCKVTSQLTSV